MSEQINKSMMNVLLYLINIMEGQKFYNISDTGWLEWARVEHFGSPATGLCQKPQEVRLWLNCFSSEQTLLRTECTGVFQNGSCEHKVEFQEIKLRKSVMSPLLTGSSWSFWLLRLVCWASRKSSVIVQISLPRYCSCRDFCWWISALIICDSLYSPVWLS